MAVTIAVVFAGKNRLRYLCTTAAVGVDAGTITTTGAATPDVQTDSTGGALETIAKCPAQGYGPFPAGALVQAEARQLWLSDRDPATANPAPNIGPQGAPETAMARLTRRTGTHTWRVDANVDGSGNPTIVVTAIGDGAVADGTAYLDIFIPGAIGA